MKYCYKCGAENIDTATFCSNCGTNLISPPPEQVSHNEYLDRKPPMPTTYLWQSIVVTILCCVPLGIIAIVNAAQVESRYNVGNFVGAEKASRNARNFSLFALIATAVVIIIYILLALLGLTEGLDLFDGYY